MKEFRKKSLCRYGLAILVVAGFGLVGVANQSPADTGTNPPKVDYDCWLSTNRICHLNYYGDCYGLQEGDECFRCPYVVIGAAHCVRRPEFQCLPTNELPFDCGPKMWGICSAGQCYGDIPAEGGCVLLQCTTTHS